MLSGSWTLGGGLEYFQRDRLGLKEGDLQERKVKCGEIDGGPEGILEIPTCISSRLINVFDLLTPADMHRIYSEASPSLCPPPFQNTSLPPLNSRLDSSLQNLTQQIFVITCAFPTPYPQLINDCLEYLAPRTRSSYHSSVRMPVCALIAVRFPFTLLISSKLLLWLRAVWPAGHFEFGG